jgi:regulation of enolase protein 1 (concanavalin A-like superfamily)
MKSLSGNAWGKANNARNLLLRPLPEPLDGLAAEVTLTGKPQAAYEQAGIMWCAGQANYVKLIQERYKGQVVVNFVRETDDQPAIVATSKPLEAETVSLRLASAAGKVTAQYRLKNDEPWQTVGTCPSPRTTPTHVGLFTMMGPKEERWVAFRDFQLARTAAVKP